MVELDQIAFFLPVSETLSRKCKHVE